MGKKKRNIGYHSAMSGKSGYVPGRSASGHLVPKEYQEVENIINLRKMYLKIHPNAEDRELKEENLRKWYESQRRDKIAEIIDSVLVYKYKRGKSNR